MSDQKPAFDPAKPFNAPQKPAFNPSAAFQSGPSPEESALRGAASGITAGFDDEVTGAIGAAGRLAGVKNLGSWKPFDPNSHLEMASEPLSAAEIVKAYRENRDAIREQQKQDMESNPVATVGGNLAGAIISPVNKLAFASDAETLAKSAEAAKAAGDIEKAASLAKAAKMAKLGAAVKTGAAQGAVFGAGGSDSDLTKGEVGQFAADTAMGAGIGAAIPPAIEAAKAGVSKGAQGAASVGKKVFSGAFGVTEENIGKYLANPDRINGAKSLEEIKDLVDEHVGKLRDAVEQGKVNESEAKEALGNLKSQVTQGLADKKMDAKDALRAAEDAFDGAKEKVLAPLKATTAPTDRAGDVSAMVGELKAKVQGKSAAALETLNESGSKIDLSPVYHEIDKSIDKLRGAGTDEAMAVAEKLQGYKTRLMTQNWANVGAPEAKRLIQGLDAITEYSPMQGSFDKAKNAAFKGVRGAFDTTLKDEVPAYRAQMAGIAPEAKLLNDANAAFGSPEVAVGKLGRLNTPRGQFDRATLAQLEAAVGKQGLVTTEADNYARAQRVLKDPQAIRKIEQGLPEYQTLRESMADVAKRNPKWTRLQIEQATAKERKALAAAVAKRVFAENEFAPFKGLAPGSTEAKIKSVMNGRSIENEKVLGQLGKKTGQNLIQMADDLSVKQAFEKPFHHGARNTLIWTAIGTVFGGMPGAGIGATYGALVDRYGPKMAKGILDGIVKVREIPSVQTIRSLGLPSQVKEELEREFKLYMIMNNAGEGGAPRKVAEQGDGQSVAGDAPKGGPDRWAMSGLEKLGIKDSAIAQTLLQSKKGKSLLIAASDLQPGSKAMQKIQNQIQNEWGNP